MLNLFFPVLKEVSSMLKHLEITWLFTLLSKFDLKKAKVLTEFLYVTSKILT